MYNQILNALFTPMRPYQHPRRLHYLALLCMWRKPNCLRTSPNSEKNTTSLAPRNPMSRHDGCCSSPQFELQLSVCPPRGLNLVFNRHTRQWGLGQVLLCTPISALSERKMNMNVNMMRKCKIRPSDIS